MPWEAVVRSPLCKTTSLQHNLLNGQDTFLETQFLILNTRRALKVPSRSSEEIFAILQLFAGNEMSIREPLNGGQGHENL